jgi:hypothetical protein
VAGVFLSVLQRPKALAQGPVAAQLAAEAAKQKPSQTPPASAIRLSQDLTLMVVEWCGVGGVGEGRPMDKRRSYYLHSKQDVPNRLQMKAGSIWTTSPSSFRRTTTCGPRMPCRPAAGVCFVVYLPCITCAGRTRPMSNVVRSYFQAASRDDRQAHQGWLSMTRTAP